LNGAVDADPEWPGFIMSVRRFAVLVVTCCLAAPAARGQSAPDPKSPDLSRAAEQVIDLTNQFRRAEGRGAVTANAKLTAAARDFAAFMARTGKYGHDADGRDPAARVKQQGYDYCLVAENIAYAFRTTGFTTDELAKQFVEGWKDSPPHRKNMLDPDMTETGVGIARSADTGNYYAVQLFGRPQSLRIEFRIANRAGALIRYTVGDQSYDLRPVYIQTHQLCRPEGVTFHWPEGAQPATSTVRPANGDRYVVVKTDSSGLAVRKE
jgi:uncharacterized protein YkwD